MNMIKNITALNEIVFEIRDKGIKEDKEILLKWLKYHYTLLNNDFKQQNKFNKIFNKEELK